MKSDTTTENAYERFVVDARSRVDMARTVTMNYLDTDFDAALARYSASVEFARVKSILGGVLARHGRVLDVGAGRGLTSAALASAGATVVSVEYDTSDVVGVGALAGQRRDGVRWSTLRGDAERLPFSDGAFDVVFCRSVLHHFERLDVGLREMARVLRPGGQLLALNEHIRGVFSRGEAFLRAHPAVAYGVNEQAYPVRTYVRRLRQAGLRDICVFGYPLEYDEFIRETSNRRFRGRLLRLPGLGRGVARLLYVAHLVSRRHLRVPEATLPAVSLMGQKPLQARARGESGQ